MAQDILTFERTYDSPVVKVWDALTDLQQMKQWYFPMLENFEPKIGFETRFNIHHEGKDFLHHWSVTEVLPLEKISYEWRYGGYPGISLLTFELQEVGQNTRLKLTHARLNSFLPNENPELSSENFEEGWTSFLDVELKNFLHKN